MFNEKYKTVMILNLLTIIREAGEEAGRGNPIWDEIRNSYHGNQQFSNDSLFIYTLPSYNGEALSEVQKRIENLCYDAIEDHTIIFSVSW